jgi:hypothetical protein
MIEEDLKPLARIKVKIEILQKLFDAKVRELKEKLKTSGEKLVSDPDGILSVKLTTATLRNFNIDGVREVLGDDASVCIKEKVDPKKFDALVKSEGEYTITEEEQKKCFFANKSFRLDWNGFDVFKHKLEEQTNASTEQ